MKFWTVLLAAALALGALDADAARRLGGGGSIGRQSSNVTQRQSTAPAVSPTSPTSPTTSPTQAQRAPEPAPATTTAPQPQRSRWGGMLGGLAAGLGLAALAHALGFGAGFGNILLVLIVGLLAVAAFGMMRRRSEPVPAGAPGPYQNSGLSADAPISPRQYNPQKVGNDASARPWESGYDTLHAQDAQQPGRIRIGSALGAQGDALSGSQNWGVPPGFDVDGFLAAAKRNFTTLQEAWDRGDVSTLRSMMTDEMLGEIRTQLAERDRAPVAAAQKTDVVMLEAQLLGIEELATEYMASVEFSGMIREEPSAGPAPFREVWNMIKTKDGSSGWLVAGVQALQ